MDCPHYHLKWDNKPVVWVVISKNDNLHLLYQTDKLIGLEMIPLFRGGGTPILNGYGCKAHTSKGLGIRWEHNLKNWGVIGWEAKFWFKIRGHWVKMLLWSFSERFKIRNLQKIIENGKNDQFVDKIETKSSFLWKPNAKKIGGLWVRAIEEPIFHQKMWGLWVTRETISKNMGSLGDRRTENKGSLEPYIRVTSIMGVPPPGFILLLWQRYKMLPFVYIKWTNFQFKQLL